MSQLVDYDFPEFQIKGAAIAFTTDSFDKYVDETIRNADDAAHSVLVRYVAEPPFEEVEAARRRFPLFAHKLCDILIEVAGFVRDSAIFDEPLAEDTPPGVLGLAGLSAAEALKLREQYKGERLRIVVAHDNQRKKLFACVLRPDEDAVRLLREERKNGKGYGKACRSAALTSIVWSNMKPEDAFARWPALPALALADKIVELGGATAERRFRRR